MAMPADFGVSPPSAMTEMTVAEAEQFLLQLSTNGASALA
jgi:hypothetical protein